jgi:hypothetical protein
VSGCCCMGPQNGQPLCPCRMRAVEAARPGWLSASPAPVGREEVFNALGCIRLEWQGNDHATISYRSLVEAADAILALIGGEAASRDHARSDDGGDQCRPAASLATEGGAE